MATTRANTRICLRRDTYDNYMFNNPTLYEGEISLVYLPDSQKICLAIGDGETPFRDLTLYNLEPIKEKIVPTTYDLYETAATETTGKALKVMSERLAAHENLNQVQSAANLFGACGITMVEAIENLAQAWQTLGSNVQTAIAEDLAGKRNASEFIDIMEEEEQEEEPKTELTNSIEEFRNYINNLN